MHDSITPTRAGQRSLAAPSRLSANDALAERYDAVRRFTRVLCEPLQAEDFVIQSMPDASPTRWHLAHTTWFFETFILTGLQYDYRPFNPAFNYLFNSYYNAVGEQFPRPRRGLLSRPTVDEVFAYRTHVDDAMRAVLREFPAARAHELAALVELGLQHEQQHQELMLTDIKHVFSCNPLGPVYRERDGSLVGDLLEQRWFRYESGLRWIGHDDQGFCYDNERPRHRVFLEEFQLAARPVTNAEYVRFIEDRGYDRPDLWLSDGWATVQEQRWRAPLYWQWRDGQWWTYTLAGLRPVEPAEPVCHVSFYEADAFARWSGSRLPTEAEWEVAAECVPMEGNFVESQACHPLPQRPNGGNEHPHQLFGDVWEWTASPYVGYPGYRPPDGAIGEYNGKFMCNQMVLRGGSCATSQSHIRRTYRNFFPPAARWQFTGFRLAQ